MSELSHYEKTGYLHDDFKIFHLKDTSMRPIDFHYHDFHKILIFRKGNISYNVEGRTYDLIPGDIVFVPAGTVHRPVLHSSEIYERIIIYISRHYLDACHDSDDLSLCLKEAHQKKIACTAYSGTADNTDCKNYPRSGTISGFQRIRKRTLS